MSSSFAPTSSRSLHSSPSLPSYPQSREDRVSLQPRSAVTPSSSASRLLEGQPGGTQSSVFLGDDDHEPEGVDEVVMAIDMKDNGALGCAYYVAADEALFLQEDTRMAGIETIESLLLQVEPTVVLVPLRTADFLVDFLEAGAQNLEGNREYNKEGFRGVYILRTVVSTCFNYETAKNVLLSLDMDFLGSKAMHFNTVAAAHQEPAIGHAPGNNGYGSRLQFATFVNLDSRLSIGCAGAVLSDIQRRRAAACLPNDPDVRFAFRVRSVMMFTFSNAMFINSDALEALQILGSESHPNRINQASEGAKSAFKENLSLYGLFRALTHTAQGRAKLRQMFLCPSIDLDLIYERQRTIAVFLRSENNADINGICKILRKVKNVKSCLLQLKKGANLTGGRNPAEQSTYAALQAFSVYMMELRQAVCRLQGWKSIHITSIVIDSISSNELRHVGEIIAATIDFVQSKEARRTCVLPNVDPELDELKRNYDGLEYLLNEVATSLIAEIPEWGRPHVKNCIFYPQIGFLTVVSYDAESGQGKYEGEGNDDDVWESLFVADEYIYYKNRHMRDLDRQYGDLYCMILADKEIDIIYDLGVRILQYEEALIAASDYCGELDSLLALALGADIYKLTAPRMTTANVIQIREGRHPLQELAVPSFVANDILLVGGSSDEDEKLDVVRNGNDEPPSVMVMTGPNHSGKSVYLKQVALIVFMAHIGSFVPADYACIGLTDRLLTRISTQESVSRNESAFAIDLRQAAFSINFATRRSLVLIDEFGKGTNAMDGAGLATALVDHFLSLNDERPKVLAATHFHEIFEHDFLGGNPRLSLAHMDVRIDAEADNREGQVTYLFRLTPGRCTSSFGGRCAAMNGVDQAVVQRSDAIALLLARGEDLRAACARLSEAEKKRLEQAELAARGFLELDFSVPSVGAKRKTHGDTKPAKGQLQCVLGFGHCDESG
ncbi:putative MSH5 protein [Coniella lustricola]|uniref:DNA mismatch repair protein MSH5 n=1 Tax=Coniella lustricola TaxID=2025994 RepID=A0A2T3A2E8_9PEZI|nr:putative MSH5 protein [Coniella lustricola]